MGALAECYGEQISIDYLWRRKELDVSRMMVRNNKKSARAVARKSCIFLLYAHWEGFARTSFTLAIDGVNEHLRRGILSFGDLTEHLKSMALFAEYRRRSSSEVSLYSFGEIIRPALGNLIGTSMSSSYLVNTRSNLNTSALIEMLYVLGLEPGPYRIKELIIDERICGFRHQLAHGEHKKFDNSIDDQTFEDTIESGLELLVSLKNDLMNFLVNENFKKQDQL